MGGEALSRSSMRKRRRIVSACEHIGNAGEGKPAKKKMDGPIHRGLVSALIPEETESSRVHERQKTKGIVAGIVLLGLSESRGHGCLMSSCDETRQRHA
jgi:hypothetical protein